MWTATLRCFVTWIVCSGAVWPLRGTAPCSNDSSPRATSRRSRRWSFATGRWSWASAGGSWSSPHDADDAFQATFLVLARKAARLRAADRLGPWLYGVATRVAKKARTRAARHRHETLTECPARERREAEWSDVMPILDAELGRLPSRHRDVLVLCLLEGASAEEAAHRLGCPVGTVKSRLARGRKSLRDRLIGRGIAPSLALAALSASEGHTAPLSQPLIRATLGSIASSATRARRLRPDTRSDPEHVLEIDRHGLPSCWRPRPRRAGGCDLDDALPAQGPGNGARVKAEPSQDRREVQTNNLKQIGLAFHNYASHQRHLPCHGDLRARRPADPELAGRFAPLPRRGGTLPAVPPGRGRGTARTTRRWQPGCRPSSRRPSPRAPGSDPHPRVRGQGDHLRWPAGRTLRGHHRRHVEHPPGRRRRRAPPPGRSRANSPSSRAVPCRRWIPAIPRVINSRWSTASVHSLALQDASLLPAIITRAGGEVITWPPVRPPGSPTTVERGVTLLPTPPVVLSTPATGATGGMTPVQALEQRMQRMEEKLEMILKRLDRLGQEGRR